MRNSIRYSVFMLTCFLVLLLSACGGTGGGDAKSETIINVHDNYFDPKNVIVKANEPVKVTFVNKGTSPHIVEIKGLISETTLQPGEKRSFTLTAQKRSYKLYDELYVGKGMEGTFEGTETGANNSTTPNASSINAPEIKSAIAAYRTYIEQETDKLVVDTQTFVDAISAGNITKARQLYGPARQHYERIEPIAESLGQLDPKIDAREHDVPDNEWGGFHRLEKALWVENTTKGLDSYTKNLMMDIKNLQTQVKTIKLIPTDIVDGAVELLNEASHSKITGEEERYSHTDLYDLDANFEGSKVAFQVFKDFLEKKNLALHTDVTNKFTKLEDALKPFRTETGFVDYQKLTDQHKRDITQALNAVGEPLSKVAIELPQK